MRKHLEIIMEFIGLIMLGLGHGQTLVFLDKLGRAQQISTGVPQ